ncbi:MAG: SET domain-containing protein [Gammaproteobacteria bacterium]|jgi:hypothetical protein
MIHPNTKLCFINDVIGYGVVATTKIPKGTIVWCLDQLDQIIPPDRVQTMAPQYQDVLDKYAFRDKSGNFVLCWDNSRFINHSFRPNCLPTPYDLELAVRDIMPGEELVDHYGALNLQTPFRALPEPGVRRRVVYPNDIVRHHRTWDRQLAEAFRCFDEVEQPLLPLIRGEFQATLAAIAAGRQPMDSCLQTFCDYSDSREALPVN